MENILLINETKRKNLKFTNCNFIFGYSSSGKTSFLENLNLIFSGKDKTRLYNGSKIVASDFNVIYISSNENINTHLKLSSKSLLSKYLLNESYSSTFKETCNTISQSLETARKEIEESLSLILNDARVSIKSIDDPLDFLLSNISITCSDISSSDEKKSLFRLISSLSKLENTKTIVLIDDFINSLDEENIISFVEEISNLDAYFILSSNKPIPQFLLNENTTIFAMRNDESYCFQELNKLVVDAIDGQPDYISFEEYMLGRGYLENSGISKAYLKIINQDIRSNFLRILTSKNPCISNEYIPGKITIIPKSKEEEKIYLYIMNVLGISNDN